MDFSLLIEIQLADPSPAAERRAYDACVRQAVLADELGYHALWAVEHHGLLRILALFGARGAARAHRRAHATHPAWTCRHALTPGRYNHPIRVAERIAVLDILSGGRVNWGSGKSSSLVEQGAFEVDRGGLDSEWREALEMIPKMWRSDLFEWSGRHYRIPPIAVDPETDSAAAPADFRRLLAARDRRGRRRAWRRLAEFQRGQRRLPAKQDRDLSRKDCHGARPSRRREQPVLLHTRGARARRRPKGMRTRLSRRALLSRSRWRPTFSRASGSSRPSTCRAIR